MSAPPPDPAAELARVRRDAMAGGCLVSLLLLGLTLGGTFVFGVVRGLMHGP